MILGLRQVIGPSMMPAYESGVVIVVSNLIKPRVGSVVVALLVGEEVIKRVRAITTSGKYYLEGDNHSESTDSREYGPVSAADILGVVLFPRRR